MVYNAIFISDVHLGTKGCKAEELINFLKNNTASKLYLIGDILDGWKIQQNKWVWKQTHSNVIRRILGHAKNGTEVFYAIGNHDEFIRPLLPYKISFGKIKLANQFTHNGIDGKKYLVVHGDLFDGITRLAPWISFLGDRAYDMLLSLNTTFNRIRHRFGFGYWSLSKYLKHRVKRAMDFMFRFENNMADYCIKRGYDGVICGHIHYAEIKTIKGITYMNDGDWVESCSALVENVNGSWEIIYWTKKQDVDIVPSGS